MRYVFYADDAVRHIPIQYVIDSADLNQAFFYESHYWAEVDADDFAAYCGNPIL